MMKLDQERVHTFLHPRKHFAGKARSAIEDCKMKMKQDIANDRFDEMDETLRRCFAYYDCLNEKPEPIIASLQKKRNIAELRMMIRALKDEKTPEYTWVKAAEKVYCQIVNDESTALLMEEGAIDAAIQRVLKFPKVLKYGVLLEEVTRRLIDLDYDRNRMVQSGFVTSLLCSIENIPQKYQKVNALTTLLVFSNTKQLVHVLLKAGITKVLVQVRNEMPAEAELVTLIAKAFKHVGINKQAMVTLSAEGAVSIMIGILRRSPRLAEMVRASVLFFRNALKFLPEFEKVLDNGLIPALTAAMIAQRADHELLLNASQLVDELSFIERARVMLLKENILDLLKTFHDQVSDKKYRDELQQLMTCLQSPRTLVEVEEGMHPIGSENDLSFVELEGCRISKSRESLNPPKPITAEKKKDDAKVPIKPPEISSDPIKPPKPIQVIPLEDRADVVKPPKPIQVTPLEDKADVIKPPKPIQVAPFDKKSGGEADVIKPPKPIQVAPLDRKKEKLDVVKPPNIDEKI